MARKKKEAQKVEPKKVYCSDCQHFQRDTTGISHDINGVYFMGVCQRGLHPDSPIKQFADHKRQCETYKPR